MPSFLASRLSFILQFNIPEPQGEPHAKIGGIAPTGISAARKRIRVGVAVTHQAEKVEFGRIWVEHQRKKSQFCYAFKSDAVDIELSVEGANDKVRETFILSTRVFSMVTFQIERIEEKYGRKHLHFTIN